MIQLIVEIDEGMSASALPDEAQKKIADLGIQWNESTLIGTQAVEGKKLILLLSTIGGDELQEIMNEPFVIGQDEEGENIVEWFNLDWFVVAEEGILIDQSLLLPYFSDKVTIEIDEDGEETTGVETITDLNGIIQTYSGHKWMH
jgi:hypothetical protein|tara:strand:- start:242 stop:676 length:435 start_codon:yes stop_codon:yes gene_type:complete